MKKREDAIHLTPSSNLIEEVLNCQGYKVIKYEVDPDSRKVLIYMDLEERPKCPECGGDIQINSKYWRSVKHLRLFDYRTVIKLKCYQVKCKGHGLKTITCSLAKKGNSTSNMLRRYIYEMNKILQEKYVAKYFGVSPDTVKRIDKEFIRKKMKTRSLSPEIIGLDELSIGDGQTNYIHILSDIGDKEVIDIGEGRKQKDVDKTIESNKSVLGNVKFAVMDMWEAFANSIKKLSDDISIIFDKFHIVKKLNKAIDELRKTIKKKATGREREAIIGKKYILLSRKENLSEKGETRLSELEKLNKPLYKAYLLKEKFFKFWEYKTKGWAKRFFNKWKEEVEKHNLKDLLSFTKTIENNAKGVYNYFAPDRSFSMGYVEGVNNKARHLINRGYGYNDKKYLYLKIIQQCSESMKYFNIDNVHKENFP